MSSRVEAAMCSHGVKELDAEPCHTQLGSALHLLLSWIKSLTHEIVSRAEQTIYELLVLYIFIWSNGNVVGVVVYVDGV